jgi:hypothetical protein
MHSGGQSACRYEADPLSEKVSLPARERLPPSNKSDSERVWPVRLLNLEMQFHREQRVAAFFEKVIIDGNVVRLQELLPQLQQIRVQAGLRQARPRTAPPTSHSAACAAPCR